MSALVVWALGELVVALAAMVMAEVAASTAVGDGGGDDGGRASQDERELGRAQGSTPAKA